MSYTEELLRVDKITIRIRELLFFEKTSWRLHQGEQWVILGPNGSGKSIFAKSLAGLLPLGHGEIITKQKVAYLSFDTQQQTFIRENRKLDLESTIGIEQNGVTVKKFLGKNYNISATTNFFSITSLANTPLQNLSTGEMRKIFLLKTILQKPGLLILDEPFDGLDNNAKKSLEKIIAGLTRSLSLILIVHNKEEIPQQFTHIMLMNSCKIAHYGKKNIVIKNYFSESDDKKIERKAREVKINLTQPLISMHNVTVKFDQKLILDAITWEIRTGENWIILGPNGAGKSTLMQLITGDNQQSYANEIVLFGKRKNSGISLWEIKKHIGIVSSDLMLRYDKNIIVYKVILSGFFDSFGLYQKVNEKQKRQANSWIKRLRLQEFTNKNYQQLSYGQKRMVLIARAVVKSPKLLIVDEPCHGLDQKNQKIVLETLNKIGESKKTNLLFITHKESEILPCITHRLLLRNGRIVAKEEL